MNTLATFGNKRNIIPIDEWIPSEQDMIFKQVKGAFIAPLQERFNVSSSNISIFSLSGKRSYNSDVMRQHLVHYLNYFEKFYDTDKELISIYAFIKYYMDYEQSYTKDMFFNDIKKYMLSPSLQYKIMLLNRDNYIIELNYINQKDPSLQYDDEHGRMLMRLSFIMLTIIPLLTHFIYIKKISNTDDFLLEIYDYILSTFSVDLYNKLYDTASTNIHKNKTNNELWNKQDIRGINETTHTIDTVYNILINIIPKYLYSKNPIHYNYASISRGIGFQILDISYEYNFIPLSSSKSTSDDANSEFDKFEVFCIKSDESLYLQNKVNCESVMKFLTLTYGPFDQHEINFYRKKLSDGGQFIINSFQKQLIFALFSKYFEDPVSMNAMNAEDYIKLVIISKKLLIEHNLVILPYIFSGKVTKLILRKSINKRDLARLETSEFYKYIMAKYRNEKAIKQLLSYAATILASDFEIIDYYDKSIDGKKIDIIPEYILEEIFIYATLI